MSKEIERKFLVNSLEDVPGLDQAKATEVEQGYLAIDEHGEVRIRRKTSEGKSKYTQAFKSSDSLAIAEGRDEVDLPITEEFFNEFWPFTEGRRILKTRFDLFVDGYKIEFDKFKGQLSGLLIAEVEFETVEARQSFMPPEWFGIEVSANPEYKNAWMALNGIPEPKAA